MTPEPDHPKRIGDYEVLGRLGKGAMGEVFKAVQPSLNRIVAIKVLSEAMLKDADQVERFEREAKAVAMLNHPNIVQIIDKEQDGEQRYFVMEYVPGTSLDAILRQRRLSLPEAISVFKQACKGLEAAHRQNIVHRDLNPRNLLVSEDLSTVKVADFGISRVESISREQGTLSTAEVSFGTLHYIAPEQSRSMGDVDHRADIYSLGVLLYEMLTGRVPIGSFRLPSQVNSEVPSEIDTIVLKCLAAEPRERYASVGKLLQDVTRLEDQLRLGLVSELRGISKKTTSIFRTGSGLAKNPVVRWSLLGLVAAAVVAGVVWMAMPDRGAEAGGEALVVAQPEAPERPVVDPLDVVPLPEVEAPATKAPVTTAAPAPVVAPAPASEPASAPGGDSRDLQVIRDKVEAGLHQPALADLDAFLEERTGSSLLPEAYLLRAQILEAQEKEEAALAAYIEVKSRFPGTESAARALYRAGRMSLSGRGRGRFEEARPYLEEVAESYASAAIAPKALLELGVVEDELKLFTRDDVLGASVPKSIVTYRTLVEKHPAAPEAAEALARQAEAFEDLKRWEDAAETWGKLGSAFPKNRHDAWFRAARVYDRRLDDEAKALDAYRRVPTTSPEYSDAQKRIEKLSG